MTESATEIVIVSPDDLEVAPRTGPTPYYVYLASLGSDESRRTMATCLSHIAQMIGNCKAEEFPWHQLRYEHTTVIRATIVAQGKSPSAEPWAATSSTPAATSPSCSGCSATPRLPRRPVTTGAQGASCGRR